MTRAHKKRKCFYLHLLVDSHVLARVELVDATPVSRAQEARKVVAEAEAAVWLRYQTGGAEREKWVEV